jgi:uncharacterized membrane protein
MKRKAVVLASILALMALGALFPEWFAKVEYLVGYAVCSQAPDQSLFAGVHQLPMSARCMGFFAGAFLVETGMVFADERNSLWPSLPVSLTLLAFVALWGFDGINTTLANMQAFHLYPSSTPVHLVSGLLGGTGAAYLTAPFFNSLVWADTGDDAVFDGLSGVAVFMALDALFALTALKGGGAILWALAAFSVAGIVVTFALVISMEVVVLLKKNGTFSRWRDLSWIVLASVGIAILVVVGMYLLKRLGMRSLPLRW